MDRVDRSNQPPVPKPMRRTEVAVKDLVLIPERDLKESSDLGEFGVRAIQRELIARGHPGVPSVRTIGRILERWGALDGRDESVVLRHLGVPTDGTESAPAPPRGIQ